MPDLALLQAARPKCPVAPGREEWPNATEPCAKPLRYDAADDFWVCPEHGNVTTPQSLVHRQRMELAA